MIPTLPAVGAAGSIPSRSVVNEVCTLALAFGVLVAWDLSSLDLALSRWYGGAAGFPWRDEWFAATFMHAGMQLAAWCLFAVLLLGIWLPLGVLRAVPRRERIWWVAATAVCAALIPLLKHASWTSCPWSLAEFGGSAKYVSHWAIGQRDGGPGGCFPSGHASTALSFLPGWFVLRRHAPAAGRLWLGATLLAGLVFGWVQMMRGAHFLSHSLWTAWICWAACIVMCHLSAGWLRAGAPAARA